MKITVLAAVSAALMAGGCIVISKHDALTAEQLAARELNQQKSAQEVSRMATSQARMLDTSRRNFDREKARAAPASSRLGGD